MRKVNMAINAYNNVRPHMTCEMMPPESAHRNGRYKLKKWKRNFSSMEASIEGKTSYILNTFLNPKKWKPKPE